MAIFLLVHLAHLNIAALECAQNCKVKCTSEKKRKIRKEGKMELHDDTLNSLNRHPREIRRRLIKVCYNILNNYSCIPSSVFTPHLYSGLCHFHNRMLLRPNAKTYSHRYILFFLLILYPFGILYLLMQLEVSHPRLSRPKFLLCTLNITFPFLLQYIASLLLCFSVHLSSTITYSSC